MTSCSGQNASGNTHRDGQRVVDQQRGRGDQAGVVADVLFRDDVRAAAGRVGMNRLTIRERDDGEQRRDDEADGDRVGERPDAGNDQRREDEVGRVGDGRQRI